QPAPWGQGFGPLDPDGGVRAEVIAAVSGLLPAPPMVPAFDATLSEVPLVRVALDGGAVFANPNVDGAQFGESKVDGTPIDANDPAGERSVHVVLSAARNAEPTNVFTLVEKTWPASDVAGRTITAGFTTPLNRARARQVKVGEVNGFIPTLVVRGDGLSDDQSQALSTVGVPVLRDGTRLEHGADGGLLIDGELLAPSPTPASRLTAVTQLQAEVSAAAWPDVELLVSARDSSNRQVPDLGADAFEIREDGGLVVASLRRTRAAPPKVVLLFDRSTSIPMEFVTGAPTVGHAIADAIFTQFPGAQVQVAGVDLVGPAIAGPMVGTLADVDTQLGMLSGTGSEIWTAVDAFSLTGASCVVVITDAVVDDTLSNEMAARLVRGPPVLVAGVGTVDTMTAAQIARVTHGQVLTGVTDTTLPSQVTTFLAARQVNDYRIVYRAPAGSGSARQVSVSLRAPGTATTTTTYTPPVMPTTEPALSALWITIETEGDDGITHSVTRLLASGAADVEGALFGRFVLGVEAGPPSLSTLLDEQLQERLQFEAAFDAVRTQDATALAQVEKQTFFRKPTRLHFASAPLFGEGVADDFTYVGGLTINLHATLPRLGQKTVRRFDLLPLVPRETVSLSNTNTFAATLERTAGLAAFEATFAKNTLPVLRGKTLGLFDANSVESLGMQWVGVAYPAYADYRVLAPTDGSVLAFWAVHQRTGELFGVMPEGGPGSDESTEALVSRLLAILDAAGRAGEAGGYNGIKVWADLEATKVQLLGDVIMLFEGEAPPGNIPRDICNAFVDRAGGAIPGWNEANMIPNDLGSIYRLGGIFTGHQMPEVPTLSSSICDGLLGGG
ncbi:MAG: hypothetical protein U0228_32195, partial [Myxococcaceae bacterium]